jgi:hypothetical protein
MRHKILLLILAASLLALAVGGWTWDDGSFVSALGL